MRGFLYRAFRGSYGRALSTALVICFHTYFHWGLVSRSLYTLVYLSLLQVLLCMTRERTGNVWNCILCHSAYNAAVGVNWATYFIGMILLFPFCVRSTQVLLSGKNPEPENQCANQ